MPAGVGLDCLAAASAQVEVVGGGGEGAAAGGAPALSACGLGAYITLIRVRWDTRASCRARGGLPGHPSSSSGPPLLAHLGASPRPPAKERLQEHS